MSDLFPLDLVMLVDDEPDENFVNRRMLIKNGLARKIVNFENPVEGFDFLRDPESPPIDVIVLDINMPEMSGHEFLKHHSELPMERQAKTVIMLLTTSLNPRDIEHARNFSDVVYQNKPLRPEMLINSVTEAFKLKKVGPAGGEDT